MTSVSELYENAKQRYVSAELDLRYAGKQYERNLQHEFVKQLLHRLVFESREQHFERYIGQITSFDISYDHRFTIRIGKMIVGKTREQMIYVETNNNRYTFDQIDVPDYIEDMGPFLSWIYTVEIDDKCIERTVRDALVDIKNKFRN